MSNIVNYIEERLNNQTKWYEKKATENKTKFHYFQIIIIVASAIIPIVNIIDFAPLQIRVISAILGAAITGITSLVQLKKYQENWLLYRSSEESLKREKFLYLHDAGNYSNLTEDDKKKTLVESVEAILSSETSKFFAMHQPKSKQ
jgi:hypothetical protein